jgi:predicted RNA-binding Zn-ribbon protein involved in translation (DUF1610 family)
MDPLDDLEDPTDEDKEANSAFSANLSSHVAGILAPDVPGMPLSDEHTNEVLAELGGISAAPQVDFPCPQCGQEMEADVDPSSLLSFPMKYIWRCNGCGHEEARLDKYVLDNPGADASLDVRDGDDLF